MGLPPRRSLTPLWSSQRACAHDGQPSWAYTWFCSLELLVLGPECPLMSWPLASGLVPLLPLDTQLCWGTLNLASAMRELESQQVCVCFFGSNFKNRCSVLSLISWGLYNAFNNQCLYSAFNNQLQEIYLLVVWEINLLVRVFFFGRHDAYTNCN